MTGQRIDTAQDAETEMAVRTAETVRQSHGHGWVGTLTSPLVSRAAMESKTSWHMTPSSDGEWYTYRQSRQNRGWDSSALARETNRERAEGGEGRESVALRLRFEHESKTNAASCIFCGPKALYSSRQIKPSAA